MLRMYEVRGSTPLISTTLQRLRCYQCPLKRAGISYMFSVLLFHKLGKHENDRFWQDFRKMIYDTVLIGVNGNGYSFD